MAWVSVATSSGSIAGNIAMRSWLRPSLRYGSVSTMPLARNARGDGGGVDVVDEVDGAAHVAALRRLGHERLREGARLGPAVEQLGRAVAAADGELEAALVEHPAHAVLEQEQRRQRGRVVGLVEARVLERDRQAERRRHPAVARAESFDALDGRGGAQREPEAAVAGEALLGREVVHVEVGRLDREAAGARRRVDEHETVVARRGAPRSSPRSTSRCAGSAYASTVASATSSGCVPGSDSQHDRVVEERRGGGDGGELGGELAEHEVLGPVGRRDRTRRRPRTRCFRRCRSAPRSRRGARRGRRGRTGCCRRPSAPRAWRWLVPRYVPPRRRVHAPPRAAPSTVRSRSARRRGSARRAG